MIKIDYFYFKGDLISASHYGWTSEQRWESLSPMDQRISTSCKTSNVNIVIQFQFYLQIKALIQISFLLPMESYAMKAKNCRTTYDICQYICYWTTPSDENMRRKFKTILNLLQCQMYFLTLNCWCHVKFFDLFNNQ